MLRYEIELGKALRSKPGMGWEFGDVSAVPTGLTKNLRQTLGHRATTALVRYIEYPLKAARLKADVFHILDHGYSNLLSWLDSRRSVVTCHDLIPLLISRKVLDVPMASHIGWSFLFKMQFMKRAAYIITDSESTRRDILKYLRIKPERVVAIPLGVSETFHSVQDRERSAQARTKLDISRDATVILTVSGNVEYKDIPSILRTLDVIRQRGTNVKFVRVGGDFTLQERQLIKKLNLENYVRYAGQSDDRRRSRTDLCNGRRFRVSIAVRRLWMASAGSDAMWNSGSRVKRGIASRGVR